ncbi:hypothetical protein ACPOL_2197 [Acidisarcina polymorpha]|uniref:O-antigen polymerase n=2 Tax=Acidisarcina polymorpha TaxID=2211140 RepID=A0A2Z5FXE0_9BACT|nr:hypothetical protein ACPOL_2197 [Acidisarcina polymorpha]
MFGIPTPEQCLWAALIFGAVYQSYRYPLQINTAGMSPSYSDTPVAFQAAKAIVISIFCLISLFYLPKRSLSFPKWLMVILVAFMSGYPLLKIMNAGAGNSNVYLDTVFWPLAALVLVLSTNGISYRGLDRFFRFIFLYALLSNAVEVTLFLTIGRLPALAWADSWVVRFGGFLDDPNGFAALLFMLLGWVHVRFTGGRRFAAEAGLVLCLFLTQSLSAIGFLLLLTVFMAFRWLIRKPILIGGIGVLIATLLSFVWSSLSSAVAAVIALRQGSIDDHLSGNTLANLSSGLDWLFGIETYTHYESWWVGALVNFGLPWYSLFLTVMAALMWSVIVAFRGEHDCQHKAVLSGILLLSAYFVVGNANLPFFHIFPISFFFFCFSFLVFFGKINGDGADAKKLPMGRPAPLVSAPAKL